MKVIVNEEAFAPVYYPYLTDYSQRYNVYYGGSGSGKSHFITQKLILKAIQSQRKIVVMRKIGKEVRLSVFALFEDVLKQIGLHQFCEIRRTDFTIIFPNGSVFYFRGLDDQEKIKSIAGISDFWLEEGTEFSLDDYLQIDLRLRAPMPDLQIYVSFNPTSKANWVYKHFFAEKVGEQWVPKPTPARTFILQSTYLDNPFLDESYKISVQNMIQVSDVYYKVYALGEFCSLNQTIFTNFKVGKIPNDRTSLIHIVGLDFGYTADPTALVEGFVDDVNKYIYITRELYEKGLLNNQIADRIIYMGLNKDSIIADAAEQKSIAEIKRLNIPRIVPAEKGPGSVLQGIQKLQQYTIIVDPTCTNLLIELETYAWKKDKSTGEYINEPIDAYNHLMDALRYAMQIINRNTKLKTMPKANLGL